jgi:glycerate kinase
MKIIIAIDSFKGSLSSVKACKAVGEGISAGMKNVIIVEKPIADGGEGTAETLINAANGRWIEVKTTGPLPDMAVEAGFGWFEDKKIAVVEMAKASGLELLEPGKANPMKSTTFGTGELIRAAMEMKPAKILLAVGGSATVDGGTGAAAALGWRFLDTCGNEVFATGGTLCDIAAIQCPCEIDLCPMEVLCDVSNPLTGPSGAAYVYGPQKGATAEMVVELELGMKNIAGLIKDQLNKDIENIAGAGAAGGLAGGAIAFFDARLVSGIKTVMDLIGIDDAISTADWVITGEGCFDEQSLNGKVVGGIAEKARHSGTRVAVIAGSVNLEKSVYGKYGIDVTLACRDEDMSLEYSMNNVEKLLYERGLEFARNYLG